MSQVQDCRVKFQEKVRVTENPASRTELVEAVTEFGLRALHPENDWEPEDMKELKRVLSKTIRIENWVIKDFLEELTFEQMILLLAFAAEKIL